MHQSDYYDICIIGSGPASAFVANEISSTGKRIVIVESGSDLLNTDITNTIDIHDSNISGSTNFGMPTQTGGASNLWGGWLVRMNKIDLIERPIFNFKGWPIKFKELSSYYKRVDSYLKLSGTDDLKYNSSNLQLRESEIMDVPFNTQNIIGDEIIMLKEMEAQKLICNSKHTKIKTLECIEKKTNHIKHIKAKQFILGAGGINNNRIMLHSFSLIRNHLSFDYAKIGKGISTHPKAEIGHIKLYNDIDLSHDFIKITKKKFSFLKYQIGLDENILVSNNVLNHCLRIDLPSRSKFVKLLEKISSYTLKSQNLMFFKVFFLSKLLSYFGQILFKLIETFNFSTKNNKDLNVRCFFDQEIRNSNEIILSSKISNTGMPLVKINWQFDKKDWDNVELFLTNVKKEVKELNIGEFTYKVPTNYIGIHSHFIGGTIMGENANESIVDKNLKVHGIDNLYISGPSVFPSFGYANPFYTIAALSIRLSDHLKKNL